MRVKPPTNGIAAVTPNHYTTSRTACSWQSDLFVCIASCHETECLTGGTIADDTNWRAGRAGGPNEKRFQMKNVNFRLAAQKIEGRAGRLQKRTGQAAEKGSPPACPFPLSSLMCSLPARLNNVQPTGRACSAVCRPALCAARQPAEDLCFAFGNMALQTARPASPSFSVISQ